MDKKVLLYVAKVEFMWLPSKKHMKLISLKSFLRLLNEQMIILLGLLLC